MTAKQFRKVVKVTSFIGAEMIEEAECDNWILVLIAIPFVGTFMILLYLYVRGREEYYVEIKRKPR